jgi:5-methylcytosine-specific restriction endonuclease McrA
MKKGNRKRLAHIDRTDDLYGLQPQSKKRWRQLLKILGDACLKCGAQPVTRDHIVPIARGGLNHPANLQPLCRRCNGRKNDNIVDYRTQAQRDAVLARWPLERVPLEEYNQPVRTTIAEFLG